MILPYGHFDHVVACGSPFGNQEVSGHIDLGNHLAAFRLCIRKGSESQDIDRMLAYLAANKQRILAILQPVALAFPGSLPQAQLPAFPGSLPQATMALPQGLPFA